VSSGEQMVKLYSSKFNLIYICLHDLLQFQT
jgi:hypothetical protein